ncbi:MAG: transporter [Candidatus Babeliales bacterium]
MRKIVFIILITIKFVDAQEALIRDLPSVAQRITTGKGQLQLSHEIEYFKAEKNYDLIYTFNMSYGTTERTQIDIFAPFFFKRKTFDGQHSGIADLVAEFQWRFFQAPSNLAIIMGGITLPTGRSDKMPFLGSGKLGFTIEGQFLHSSDYWFFDFGPGAFLTRTHKNGTKIGNSYFLDMGFGRRFKSSKSDFFLVAEFDAFIFERDKIKGITDLNSGANVIFFGPLFIWTRKNLVVELLVQGPIGQHLFGIQRKFDLHTSFFVQVTL